MLHRSASAGKAELRRALHHVDGMDITTAYPLLLNLLQEAERWVLSLGTHATVIRPEKLRERLAKATEELWRRYGGPMMMHGRRWT